MRTGVYFCNCGTNISERIDFDEVSGELLGLPDVAYVHRADFVCSEDGKQFLEKDLLEHRPERVVVAACSPREYEGAFMQVLGRAGMNPYFLQMVNIREHVAWVTPDVQQATRKALAQIRGGIARVERHQPLEKKQLEVCRDVVVIGAGPAGLKCALTLAEAGRHVVLVEKSPVLGGLPVRYEELFPNMECGPCMLEPVMGEVMHGPHAGNIQILTMAEVIDVTGYYGNFTVKVRQTPRHVDGELCIGCGECIPPCPAGAPNEFNFGLDRRKAIALPFAGALPNIPFLDEGACLRGRGEDCELCRNACPVEGAVRYEDAARTTEHGAGAIVVAIGSGSYDCRELPQLGHGTVPGVYTSLEFERLLASNGPTAGELGTPRGSPPTSAVIVHCVGSLDEKHRPYCSGVCCGYALKFSRLIAKKLPGAGIHHLYRELAVPGKEAFASYLHATRNPNLRFARYQGGTVRVSERNGQPVVDYEDAAGEPASITTDLVVLCPAVTAAEGAGELAGVLDSSLVTRFPQKVAGY